MAFSSSKMRHKKREIALVYVSLCYFFKFFFLLLLLNSSRVCVCVQISIQNEQIRHTELVFVSFDLWSIECCVWLWCAVLPNGSNKIQHIFDRVIFFLSMKMSILPSNPKRNREKSSKQIFRRIMCAHTITRHRASFMSWRVFFSRPIPFVQFHQAQIWFICQTKESQSNAKQYARINVRAPAHRHTEKKKKSQRHTPQHKI